MSDDLAMHMRGWKLTHDRARDGVLTHVRGHIPDAAKAWFGTVDHEMGHILMEETFTSAMKAKFTKLTNKLLYETDWQLPSLYAHKDRAERFAECYTAFVNGFHDLLTEELVEYFEDLGIGVHTRW